MPPRYWFDILSVAGGLCIGKYVVHVSSVSGPSMEPTYRDRDVLLSIHPGVFMFVSFYWESILSLWKGQPSLRNFDISGGEGVLVPSDEELRKPSLRQLIGRNVLAEISLGAELNADPADHTDSGGQHEARKSFCKRVDRLAGRPEFMVDNLEGAMTDVYRDWGVPSDIGGERYTVGGVADSPQTTTCPLAEENTSSSERGGPTQEAHARNYDDDVIQRSSSTESKHLMRDLEEETVDAGVDKCRVSSYSTNESFADKDFDAEDQQLDAELRAMEAGAQLKAARRQCYLGSTHLWMLGDNAPNSHDSRHFGSVHPDRLQGVVIGRLVPGWLVAKVKGGQ